MSHRVLAGQRALVTGANSGIGEGVAIALGKAGAKVVVNYISSEERANTVVETIKSNSSDALAIRADVSISNPSDSTASCPFGFMRSTVCAWSSVSSWSRAKQRYGSLFD
jgi:NAD(P)-dependent dehydrogenase (short-subunit alcohol dehydrogenase family)